MRYELRITKKLKSKSRTCLVHVVGDPNMVLFSRIGICEVRFWNAVRLNCNRKFDSDETGETNL